MSTENQSGRSADALGAGQPADGPQEPWGLGAKRWVQALVGVGAAVAALRLAAYSQQILLAQTDDPFSEPLIPHVGFAPWAPWNEHTHFFSGAGHLGRAILIALVTAALVEVIKSGMARREALTRYVFFLVFQVFLTWGAFAQSSGDWSSHFQSLFLTHGAGNSYSDHRILEPYLSWLVFTPLAGLLAVELAGWGRGGIEALWRLRSRLWLPILFVAVLGLAVSIPSIDLGDLPKPEWTWLALAALAAFTVAKVRQEVGLGRAAALAPKRSRWWVPALLGGAWILAALAPAITRIWFPPGGGWANLGDVAAFPWTEQAEIRSTTVSILGALVVALAAVGLVELAKIVRIRDFDGSGYGWLVGFQALLLADVLATAASDWSVFFLSLAWPSLSGAGPGIFPGWPWASLLALSAGLALSRRRDLSRAAAWSAGKR